jgi:hypothetical protein
VSCWVSGSCEQMRKVLRTVDESLPKETRSRPERSWPGGTTSATKAEWHFDGSSAKQDMQDWCEGKLDRNKGVLKNGKLTLVDQKVSSELDAL